jgi:4-aminobutyrate aminotransferase
LCEYAFRDILYMKCRQWPTEKETLSMDDRHLSILRDLVPHLDDIPMSSAYWMDRAERVIATSTQDRDVYPVVDHTRGHGVYIYDLEGNEYLDLTAGVAVQALGWRHEGLIEFEAQVHDVISELPGQDFDHIPQILLAERLIGTTPGTFAKNVFFTTSGGRAVESAVKAAMDFTGRQRFVAFRPAFHGRTGYALALTASKAAHREGFPQALPIIRTNYAYPYRSPMGTDEECARHALAELEYALSVEGTDIAAIVAEPIVGEGGILVPPPEFLVGLRQIADKYGALLIADEVQTGLGRTGRWWAIEHSNVVPDIIVTAKALGGGTPMGAIIGRAPLFSRPGRHSETFSAEPRAALVSLFVLKTIEEDHLRENAERVGKVLLDGLKHLKERHPNIGDVRGQGLMIGIEFVEDPKSKRFAPALRESIVRNCVRRQKLWVLGSGPSTIRFLPPLIISEEQAHEALRRFEAAVVEETAALVRA